LLEFAFVGQAALWFALDRSAVSLAGSAALLPQFVHATRRRFGLAWAILALQFAGIAQVGFSTPTGPWRLGIAALVLFYFGAALSWTIVRLGWTKRSNVILHCASLLGSVFLIEAAWDLRSPILPDFLRMLVFLRHLPAESGHPVMVGNGFLYDSVHGNVPVPYGRQTMFFASNPRGYFFQADPERESWRLASFNGNQAVLRSSEPDRLVRVEIRKLRSRQPWEVSLSREKLAVEVGQRYRLHFRVRAEQGRKITYTVMEDGPPWTDKGLFREIAIGPQWQQVDDRFEMSGRIGPARLGFNLGADPAAVEIADVRLSRDDTGQIVPPVIPGKYFLMVEQNDHGCRALDYAVPRPDRTVRIVALGNSGAFGWGVKYEDLFTTVIERLLNGSAERSASGWRFEVINCAVPAYGSAEERWLYETMLADYGPQIVLLMTGATDNKSVAEREKDMERVKPYPWERVFLTPYLLRLRARYTVAPDYSSTAAEVLALASSLEREGARLVIAEFEMVGPENFVSWRRGHSPWFNLLSRTLSGTRATLVDLGPAIYDGRQAEDLMVYPGDPHQNEVVHRAAAAELVRALEQSGLLARAMHPTAGD
jgi:hypothetical protein